MKFSPHFVRLLVALPVLVSTSTIYAFEGRINVHSVLGGQTIPLQYTVGADFLRVEMSDGTRPNPVNVLDRRSGVLTMLFPHNRSFVRVKPAAETTAAPSPGVPPKPKDFPAGGGATGPSGQPVMPAMPAMPLEALELKSTGEKTNLLGFACERYQIKQRGEVMEIWATDKLLPFQNYLRNQPPRIALRMLEERWAGLLTAKKLFPLRASLRFENGAERYRFEVRSITPQKLKDEDLKLFQPPEGYLEIEPLPF